MEEIEIEEEMHHIEDELEREAAPDQDEVPFDIPRD